MPSTTTVPHGHSETRWFTCALLLIALAFYALCFVHLRADFPSQPHWDDRAKITDEGWYGSAAIQYQARGQWHTPDALDSAVVLPVWPAMLAAAFRIAGPGVVTARAFALLLYGASLALLWFILRRERPGLVPAAAIACVSVSPFCFAFNRLALLEPVLVFWLFCSFALATVSSRTATLRQIVIGFTLAMLVLTKTTGICLVPAVLYLVGAHSTAGGRPLRARLLLALRPVAVSLTSACILLGAYFIALRHSPYWPDAQLLFEINSDRVHKSIALPMAHETLLAAFAASPFFFCFGVAALAASLVLRELWRNPVFAACAIAVLGYTTFIWYHTNLQPRYFLVMALPTAALIVLAVDALWKRSHPAAIAAGCALAVAALPLSFRTVGILRHPSYSFYGAAHDIARIVRSTPSATLKTTPVVFAASGDEITLLSGLPAINDAYAQHGFSALAAQYHPGWLVAWTGFEQGAPEQLSRQYTLTPVAHYTVFDYGPDNQLVLYRLTPKH